MRDAAGRPVRLSQFRGRAAEDRGGEHLTLPAAVLVPPRVTADGLLRRLP